MVIIKKRDLPKYQVIDEKNRYAVRWFGDDKVHIDLTMKDGRVINGIWSNVVPNHSSAKRARFFINQLAFGGMTPE